ncbi:MAG: PIN domain-containing protein [Bacteroidota bacterium]
MVYIFDTCAFLVIGHYYPQRFPTFWQNFNDAALSGLIISAREVYRELEGHDLKPHIQAWLKDNRHLFMAPTPEEAEFVAEIFSVRHFQQLVGEKQRLRGMPVADPFIIAMAKIRNGYVITEEGKKGNSAKIPNICEYFGINCCNVEGFMEINDWTF